MPPADTPPRTATRTGLRVENVTKRFGGVTAVRALDLSVAMGEAMAIIGPNGAGKSSLLKLISGAYRPDEGTVHFDGTRIDSLPSHQVARHGIGLAHQVPQPFRGLTVRENVAVGAMARRSGAQRRGGPEVEAILELCGLADKAQMPAQRLRLLDLKRLELARALSTDPALILLDEVAAGLNGRELEDMIGLIRGIHATGRSLILVEHVEGVVASLVQRVLVIDWGEAIAEGTPAEVAADPRVREVYLGGGTATRGWPSVGRPRRDETAARLLSVQSVTASYGDIVALRGVTVDAGAGEIVAVLGANGAGKSSLASVISGQLRPTSGTVHFDSRDITELPDFRRVRVGVAHCPEGRRVFADLTIRENLCLSAPLRLPKAELSRRLQSVNVIFPVLDSMAARKAGMLSGGQQQMLAIGRSLMSDPRLVVCDEISLGLAPVAIDALYEALGRIRDRGVAVILIEQNVHRCLAIADRVYVLERGRVSYAGPPDPLNDAAQLDHLYFGKSPTFTPPDEAYASREGRSA